MNPQKIALAVGCDLVAVEHFPDSQQYGVAASWKDNHGRRQRHAVRVSAGDIAEMESSAISQLRDWREKRT